MPKYKPNFPLIVLYARDWSMYEEIHKCTDSFTIARGWIAGWLIQETKDSYIIAFENFDDDNKMQVRHTDVIPKETVLYKKIVRIK